MDTKALFFATACLYLSGCSSAEPVEHLLPTTPYPFGTQRDAGFYVEPRPPCSPEVDAALSAPGTSGIVAAAQRGVIFDCGGMDSPTPLSQEVTSGSLARVRALLEAGADANARWFGRGDRLPLGEVFEVTWRIRRSPEERLDLIRMLLDHGADPNARWCPFESRGHIGSFGGCTSAAGTTALMWAAALDLPGATYLLLDAGADPSLTDATKMSALHRAYGAPVFSLLVTAQFRNAPSRHADALRYLTEHRPRTLTPGPWEQTALSMALAGSLAEMIPPPPPPGGSSYHSGSAERVRRILELGADPNERITWGDVDWTPLALAGTNVAKAEALLQFGADPDGRWCTSLPLWDKKAWSKPPGCTRDTGMTPLMAAARGNRAMIELLVRFRADVTLRDWMGRTAADYAAATPRANRPLSRLAFPYSAIENIASLRRHGAWISSSARYSGSTRLL
jgi:ankyrin repeat protein